MVERVLGRAVVVAAMVLGSVVPGRANPFQWTQPGGAGSPLTLTYSFSNLLDGHFNTVLGPAELRYQTALAFDVWARHTPLNFVEMPDRGPAPSELDYFAGSDPEIRIGYEPTIGPNGAHAHLPLADDPGSGVAGDIHMNNSYRLAGFGPLVFGNAGDGVYLDYFSVMLHEIGHALGLDHNYSAQPSVMSGYAAQVFPDHELADLHPIDILNIQAIYGAGRGHVYPLGTPPPSPAPEPASIVLFGSGLALAARSRLRRDASRRSRR